MASNSIPIHETNTSDSPEPALSTSSATKPPTMVHLPAPELSPNVEHWRGDVLHGELNVEFFSGRNMNPRGGLRTCVPIVGPFNLDKTSNPFAEVVVQDSSLIRTSIRRHTRAPYWNEIYTTPICHQTESVIIRVSHAESATESKFIGQVRFSAQDIIRHATGVGGLFGEFILGNEDCKEIRIDEVCDFVLPTRPLRGRPYISMRLRYTPIAQLLSDAKRCSSTCIHSVHKGCILSVPETYFPTRYGKRWKLYQSASQQGRMGTIESPLLRNGVRYESSNLWTDMSEAINNAKEFICILGMDLNPKIRLVRPNNALVKEEVMSHPTLEEQLRKKSNEDEVMVMILLWDDKSANKTYQSEFENSSVQECAELFKDCKNICVCAVPRTGTGVVEGEKNDHVFSHHQSTVIVDAPEYLDGKVRNIGTKGKPSHIEQITAFVGSFDLVKGRFDNTDKSLFLTLNNLHFEDFLNPAAPRTSNVLGPRQPWQGIHARVSGEAAVDVLQNFLERWMRQASASVMQHLRGKPPPYAAQATAFVNKLTRRIRGTFAGSAIPTRSYNTPYSIQGSPEEEVFHPGTTALKSPEQEREEEAENPTLREVDFGAQVLRSVDSTSARMLKKTPYPKLERINRRTKVDRSLYKGHIHHIRRAKHFIYIESSVFIGSSHLWSENHNGTGATNLVPAEIAQKIVSKIRRSEPFHCYIVVPMFPKGRVQDKLVQQQLRWQFLTFEAMYRVIGEELMRQQLKRGEEVSQSPPKPEDYLSIFCLGNRERDYKAEASKDNSETILRSVVFHDDQTFGQDDAGDDAFVLGETLEQRLLRTRRFPVYVDSKLMIVDDEVALVGTGSVSQRSLSGQRDTEIGLALFERNKLATSQSSPQGEVYGFRLTLWAEHLGGATRSDEPYKHDYAESPSSAECVQYVRRTASDNWKRYVGKVVQPLYGHLMLYPLRVEPLPLVERCGGSSDGEVFQDEWEAHSDEPEVQWTGTILKPVREEFPDFSLGYVLGTNSDIFPNGLTL